jgi:hypothetical protein
LCESVLHSGDCGGSVDGDPVWLLHLMSEPSSAPLIASLWFTLGLKYTILRDCSASVRICTFPGPQAVPGHPKLVVMIAKSCGRDTRQHSKFSIARMWLEKSIDV